MNSKLIAISIALVGMVGAQPQSAFAQPQALPQTVALKDAVEAPLQKDLPVVVVVDQETHRTHVLQMQDEKLCDVFSIPNAVGKRSTPTPNGRARITQKELNPSWKPPQSIDPAQHVVPPFIKTHKNPLGLANLRLSMEHGLIALHGTNEPARIGQSVSHGCIRHLNKDIVALYKIVHVGTPVYIVPRTDDANVDITDFAGETETATKVTSLPRS